MQIGGLLNSRHPDYSRLFAWNGSRITILLQGDLYCYQNLADIVRRRSADLPWVLDLVMTRTPVTRRFLLAVIFTAAAAVAQPWAVSSARDVLTPFNAAYVRDSKLAPNRDVYLTTEEPDLPLDRAFGDPSIRNIKVARLDPQGNRRFVVRLGGVLYASILLDSAGDIYLSGRTSTFGFPATPGAYRAVAPRRWRLTSSANCAGSTERLSIAPT
jgi:hypothetical protein